MCDENEECDGCDVCEPKCDTCDELEDWCNCIECNDCGDKLSVHSACCICESSHVGCCTCCGECESQECQCCGDCGGYAPDCGCGSDTFGHSGAPGWEDRGIKADATYSTSSWQSIWPEIDSKNFDVCQEAADFYLLEAITNNVINNGSHLFDASKPSVEQLLVLIGADDNRVVDRLNALRGADEEKRPSALEETLRAVIVRAKDYYAERVNRMDDVLRAYFHMAVAGEARHHMALKARILSSNREKAWSGWRSIYDQVGPEALKDLSALFLEFEGDAYGGPPWANACDILYSREMGTLGPTEFLNKKMFVDRAWTLEHNGGCFLNKISWNAKNRKNWMLGNLRERILESHASDPPNYRMMLKVASDEVLAFWDQVWEINNELNGTHNENPRNIPDVVRKMCRACESDPDKGHMVGCRGRLTEGSPYLIVVEEEDWDNHPWSVWHLPKEEMFWDAEYNINNPDATVSVWFHTEVTVNIEPKEHAKEKWHSTTGLDNLEVAWGSGQWRWNNHSIPGCGKFDCKVTELSAQKVDPSNVISTCKQQIDEFAVTYAKDYLSNYELTREDLRITYLRGSVHVSHTLQQNRQTFHVVDPFGPQKSEPQPLDVGIKGL